MSKPTRGPTRARSWPNRLARAVWRVARVALMGLACMGPVPPPPPLPRPPRIEAASEERAGSEEKLR